MFDRLIWDWKWEPSILIGLALFVGGYLVATGPLRSRFPGSRPVARGQLGSFLLAALLIFLALVSPIDEIGDHYLFSAHMIQHMLIVLPMPVLLLLGLPDWLLRPWMRVRPIAAMARGVTAPIAAFALFNISFAVYHLPAIYDLALRFELFHIAIHLGLMALAVVNWWPVLSPLKELPPLPEGLRAFYLFFESMPATALAAFIVLAKTPLYPTYLAAPRITDLTPLADQQLAGLIMWLPGTLVYLGALTVVFVRWFSRPEAPLASNR